MVEQVAQMEVHGEAWTVKELFVLAQRVHLLVDPDRHVPVHDRPAWPAPSCSPPSITSSASRSSRRSPALPWSSPLPCCRWP
ncbi:MAG: hypothetical protein MZV70_45265 [Desulfobacterales bacterium]|nr:hypothetical protein [Desulfobacterales bacterium]